MNWVIFFAYAFIGLFLHTTMEIFTNRRDTRPYEWVQRLIKYRCKIWLFGFIEINPDYYHFATWARYGIAVLAWEQYWSFRNSWWELVGLILLAIVFVFPFLYHYALMQIKDKWVFLGWKVKPV